MVSSRSKTAAEAAANRRTTRSAAASGVGAKVLDISSDQESKSVVKKVASAAPKKAVAKPASTKEPLSSTSSTAKSSAKSKKKGGAYCVCKGEDDGTPMIKCEGACQNWYHFRCIELDEDVAGEIKKYYCPACEAKTGLKTVSKLDFEGPDAFVESKLAPPQIVRQTSKKTPLEEIDMVESPEESDGAGSEDDYVIEPVGKRARSGKRISRRFSSTDKSESDDEDGESDDGHRRRASRSGQLKRLKKGTASPAPESSSALKRRGSSAQQPAAKRSKTAESAHDDAIRKYCLTKLEEIIRPMFEEHRKAQAGSQTEDQVKAEGNNEGGESAANPSATEDKSTTDQKIRTFVSELECCMMETYAEPDKTGKPSASGKYKERFRMLQFNLPKLDRVILRKGIASGRITPAQLNVMSSTDLADEQTKHEIEIAEKESLEHSILQKITAPRAKMTHKGYEAIEDVSGQRTADAAKEEEEQRMEMEKREREKLSRLRTLSHQEGSPITAAEQSPLSATFPKPNSPTVANVPRSQQSWGAPPPLPTHVLQKQHDPGPSASHLSNRPPVRPLFVPSMSNDYASSEQGLSLADLINIDDDISAKEVPQSNPQQRMSAQVNAEAGPSSSPIISTPSGPSPFAPSKPSESPNQISFDLSSLWTGPNKEESLAEEIANNNVNTSVDDIPAVENMAETQDDAMELESVDEDDDRALDAILEQDGSATQSSESQPALQATNTIESSPEVWSGQINMPRESFDALAIDVACKQIGGRTLEPMSGYWQTLFPSAQARIDGRVPTPQSTKYLVSIRMNSTKELIAVNFIPRSDEALTKFDELIGFLVGKDRHALVFPWGTQPKAQAPGRELYIIPLLIDQPIPEFIELMDDHRLPKERTGNVLLGVFVLNKGKLVVSTPPPAPVAPVPTSMSFSSVLNVPLQMPNIPIPPLPSATASRSPVPPTPPVKINQAALAAEFASLTPEQISLMLRHLSQSAPLAASVGALAPGPVAAPPPLASPSVYTVPGMPPFPPQFTPAHQHHLQPPPHQFSPPRPQIQGVYGDYDLDERDDLQREVGRDGRGGRGGRVRGNERGRRGNRGRGKPFHDDRSARPPAADRGWGGRGRGGGTPR